MIIWGSQVTRKSMGYAAEYCPSCRTPSAMRVIQVRKYFHLYFVPISPSRPQHYESTCNSCGAVMGRVLDSYTSFIPGPDLELAVQRETTPGYEEWLEHREATEERVLTGVASPLERLVQIHTVIESLEYMAGQRSGWTGRQILIASLWILFLVFIFPAVLAGIVLSLNISPKIELIVFGTAFVFIVIMICRLVLKKQSVLPVVWSRLVNGLAPIDPTREELDIVLRELKKNVLAKSIDPDDLLIAINEQLQSYD